MNQAAIARIYNTTPQNITMHIKNIYEDGELEKEATYKEFLQVQTKGTRQIKRKKYRTVCQLLIKFSAMSFFSMSGLK